MSDPVRFGLLVVALCLAASACPSPPAPVEDAGGARPAPPLETSGVVSSARLDPAPELPATPDRATLALVATAAGQPDAAAEGDTRFLFHPVRDGAVATRPLRVARAGEVIALPPGPYAVRVTHARGPLARGDGAAGRLTLGAGRTGRLVAAVDLATASLTVAVTNGRDDVSDVARHRVERVREDAPPSLVAEGGAEGRYLLPLGRYRVTAEATWSAAAGASTSAAAKLSLRDEEVTVRLDLGRAVGGLRPAVRVAGRSAAVPARFRVFRAGADPEAPGEPLLAGGDGETLTLPVGTYAVAAEVRLGPLLERRVWRDDVAVEAGVVRDVALTADAPHGRLRVRVLREGVPVTEGIELRILAASADPDATPLAVIDGPGPVRLPPGRYDVEVRHAPSDEVDTGAARTRRERGVVVEDGAETVREFHL